MACNSLLAACYCLFKIKSESRKHPEPRERETLNKQSLMTRLFDQLFDSEENKHCQPHNWMLAHLELYFFRANCLIKCHGTEFTGTYSDCFQSIDNLSGVLSCTRHFWHLSFSLFFPASSCLPQKIRFRVCQKVFTSKSFPLRKRRISLTRSLSKQLDQLNFLNIILSVKSSRQSLSGGVKIWMSGFNQHSGV